MFYFCDNSIGNRELVLLYFLLFFFKNLFLRKIFATVIGNIKHLSNGRFLRYPLAIECQAIDQNLSTTVVRLLTLVDIEGQKRSVFNRNIEQIISIFSY